MLVSRDVRDKCDGLFYRIFTTSVKFPLPEFRFFGLCQNNEKKLYPVIFHLNRFFAVEKTIENVRLSVWVSLGCSSNEPGAEPAPAHLRTSLKGARYRNRLK